MQSTTTARIEEGKNFRNNNTQALRESLTPMTGPLSPPYSETAKSCLVISRGGTVGSGDWGSRVYRDADAMVFIDPS